MTALGIAGTLLARGGDAPSIAANIAKAGPAPTSRSATKQPPRGDAMLRGAIDPTEAELVGTRYEVEVSDGERAVLTLDPKLQAEAREVLRRAEAPMGAVVVMDVDGRILSLAGARDGAVDDSLAVSVWAPAASVFKVVTTAALVDKGLKASSVDCFHGGRRSVETSNLVDNARLDRTCKTLEYALARSQNALIAKLAHKHLEPDTLREFARDFGFSAAPDFSLDTEPNRFQIPDEPLAFARVSAGFWHTEMSPLGGAIVANTIASRGMAVTPRLVDRVGKRAIAPVPPQRVLNREVASAVADMMVGTVDYGTAYKGFHDRRGRAYLGDVEVAGKTGTLTRQSPSYLQYSWFVGFAPADHPKVVISVLLGNPPKWHLKAHTAARMVLQAALE